MAEYPEPDSIVLDDRWFVAEALLKDRPIIVRGRFGIDPLAGHPAYGRRLLVSWEYGDNGESGLPASEVLSEMGAFEDRLINVLEWQKQSITVAVITYTGNREWIFYSSDVDDAVLRINREFGHEPVRPLRIDVVDDPGWEEYRDIRQSFGGDGASEGS